MSQAKSQMDGIPCHASTKNLNLWTVPGMYVELSLCGGRKILTRKP